MSFFTKDFWLGDQGAFTRAIRTFAQTAVAAIGVGTTNLFSADLKNILAVSASAAILSILMSFDRRESLLAPPPVYVKPGLPAPRLAPDAGCSASGCGDQLR